jgi:hypothetical protein
MFLPLLSRALQLSWDVLTDVGFLCDKAVMLAATINQRPSYGEILLTGDMNSRMLESQVNLGFSLG